MEEEITSLIAAYAVVQLRPAGCFAEALHYDGAASIFGLSLTLSGRRQLTMHGRSKHGSKCSRTPSGQRGQANLIFINMFISFYLVLFGENL